MRNVSVFVLTSIWLVFPAGALAQVAAGSLTGTITDPTGAVVPKAALTIRNEATDVARALVTNVQGFYSAPNLTPGPYQVIAAAPGFATAVRSGVQLAVGAELVVDIVLRVGNANEKLEVKGEAPTVDLASSSVSAAVGGQTVRDLPLNGRDWTLLTALEPGVQVVRTEPVVSIGNSRGNRGLGTQMAVAGNRPQQNNYRLDGISINDYSNGAPGSVLGLNLGVDSVADFSVVTSNSSAEYGRSSGGVINAITRSGTNQFHGSVYEFLRNSALDARNFFDTTHGPPPFKRNQFGVSGGGPIQRNRTFIFADYEGIRQGLGSTFVDIVPSQAARSGQLTGGSVTVDPNAAPFIKLFPLPNGQVKGDIGVFTFAGQQVTTENFFTTRLDREFSSSDLVHVSYMVDDANTTGPDQFDNVLLGLISRRQLATLEETHIFSPALLNIDRFGYSRVVSEAPKTLSAINPVAADTSLGFVPGLPVGLINISGITNFSGGLQSVGEYDYQFNSFQFYDDVNLTKRSHALKFGGSVERIRANQFGNLNPNGQYSFGSLANFLTNRPTSFTSPLPGTNTPRDLRQTIAGAYVQDDWRMLPRLTLNLGMRYEMATVPTEVHGELATLVNLADPAPKLGSPYFHNPTLRDFSPRVGLSWDPFGSGKTAVRAGFGMYDVLPLTYEFNLLSITTAPFYESGSVANLAAGTFPKTAYPLLNSGTLNYSYVEQDPKRDYVMQWNLNIQRELGSNVTLEAGYVGSHGVHQPFHISDANQVPPTLTPEGYVWPSPHGSGTRLNTNVGSINSLFWQVSSSYNAGHVRVTRRTRGGLQFQAAYTWSKSLDTGSSTVAGGAFTNSIETLPWFDPRLRRGLSDFDVRNNLLLSYLWQIPSSRFKAAPWLLRGWEWSGIFQASSGLPFTPTIGGDPLGLLSAGTYDFPDRLAAPGCGDPVNPGNPNSYLKTQCFIAPVPGTRLGNGGRNIAIGPGLANFDVSLLKNTSVPRISESFHIQFRAEFFNVLNHANFSPPALANAQVFNANLLPISTAGTLTSTATTSRQMQFAIKLIW